MIDVEEKKGRILEIIKQRGPSLPIHVARGTELSMLFASAILSEMVSDKMLKVSHLKVGGSPLYYLPGQEQLLENFCTYLPSKEKEAFLLIKKSNLLEEERLQPALRVAIRNIRDFASTLAIKTEAGEKIFWFFNSFSREEALRTAESVLAKEKRIVREEKKGVVERAVKEKAEKVILEQEKPKKEAGKLETDFRKGVYGYLAREKIKILAEEEVKRRSMILKVLVNSAVGEIGMLVIARDKKSVSEGDVRIMLSYSQARRLPVLFLCNGKPSKRALQEIENFKSMLFLRQIG